MDTAYAATWTTYDSITVTKVDGDRRLGYPTFRSHNSVPRNNTYVAIHAVFCVAALE